MNKILITGTAGFIGFHLVSKLLALGKYEIFGIDNLNDYYDVNLKLLRLQEHGIVTTGLKHKSVLVSTIFNNYKFMVADIADHEFIVEFMIKERFDFVVNLAAQAGVRYSIENPRAYTHSNVDGFLSILEGSRHSKVQHLVYASTSSVYGLNARMPLSEKQHTEHPISLYSATKKANELMAHTYSHLFGIPTTGLRFFTVYGPWGRPDMALFLFAEAIVNNRPINVFNHGDMIRDFTYVDDIVESISRIVILPAQSNSSWSNMDPEADSSSAPYRIYNIGNSNPVRLTEYISALEKEFGKVADKNFMDLQQGDVRATHSDTLSLESTIAFKPQTSVEHGVKRFVEWYKVYINRHF